MRKTKDKLSIHWMTKMAILDEAETICVNHRKIFTQKTNLIHSHIKDT
jgi:hypothetical protein